MKKRLEEIKARLESATPGPWRVEQVAPDYTRIDPDVVFGTYSGSDMGEDNAQLIAHAPEDLAYLLAEVERYRAALVDVVEVALRDNTPDCLFFGHAAARALRWELPERWAPHSAKEAAEVVDTLREGDK